MTECDSDLPYNFYAHRSLVVRFADLELSSDAGILLARQAEQQMQVCQGIAECIEEWRDPNKITHSLQQLVSQRVYQLVGGYEDAHDSNQLRHDPIYKIACGRLPLAHQAHLASQPTITRLENHISKREVRGCEAVWLMALSGTIRRHRPKLCWTLMVGMTRHTGNSS